MGKLLDDYKNNGAVKSRLANFIWKIGVIFSSIFTVLMFYVIKMRIAICYFIFYNIIFIYN